MGMLTVCDHCGASIADDEFRYIAYPERDKLPEGFAHEYDTCLTCAQVFWKEPKDVRIREGSKEQEGFAL